MYDPENCDAAFREDHASINLHRKWPLDVEAIVRVRQPIDRTRHE